MHQRLTLIPIAVLAAAALAAPALAGTDGDNEAAPVVTPGPVPFVQPPAPVPVGGPAPGTPPPSAILPAKVRKVSARNRPTSRVSPRRTAAKRSARQRARAAASTNAVPRGGVQAGAGGTAP